MARRLVEKSAYEGPLKSSSITFFYKLERRKSIGMADKKIHCTIGTSAKCAKVFILPYTTEKVIFFIDPNGATNTFAL
jgi:hypothetical protein